MTISFFYTFALWYVYFGMKYFFNNDDCGRNLFLMPFQCFWEKLLWNIPGGSVRKMLYVKELVGEDLDGSIVGEYECWNYEEIRSRNLYQACADDIFPSTESFWIEQVVILGIGLCLDIGISLTHYCTSLP